MIPVWSARDTHISLSDHIVLNLTFTEGRGPITSRFDSDSVKIGIDNHATRSLSPNVHHFEDLQLKSIGKCRGLSDQRGHGAQICGIGTLTFSIQDDDGQWHLIKLPKSLYIPSAEGVLVSPQHWAQVAKDHHPKPSGTCYYGSATSVVLY